MGSTRHRSPILPSIDGTACSTRGIISRRCGPAVPISISQSHPLVFDVRMPFCGASSSGHKTFRPRGQSKVSLLRANPGRHQIGYRRPAPGRIMQSA